MVQTRVRQLLIDELNALQDATIADLTIKVGDERWREAVERCKAIRKELRRKPKGRGPKSRFNPFNFLN